MPKPVVQTFASGAALVEDEVLQESRAHPGASLDDAGNRVGRGAVLGKDAAPCDENGGGEGS